MIRDVANAGVPRPDDVHASIVERPRLSPGTVGEPRWLAQTRARLGDLAFLSENWDGRGSAAVRGDALKFALAVLEQVMPPTSPAPSTIPLGNGGVQLTWSTDSVEIDVEVIRPNEIIICTYDKSGAREDKWSATTDLGRLGEALWKHLSN
jgi:hypothetical protein